MGIKIKDATVVVNLEPQYMLPLGNVGNNEANATKMSSVSEYIENDLLNKDVFATNDRVNELDGRVGNTEGQIGDLNARVGNLEQNGGSTGGDTDDDNGGTTTNDGYIVDLETADNDIIKELTSKLFDNENKPKPSGNLITYGGKPVTGWYKKNDSKIVFTYDGVIPYTTEEEKLNSNISFEVVVNENITQKSMKEQRYPDIPENEIWYTTNNGEMPDFSYLEWAGEQWYDEENQCFRFKITNEEFYGRTPDNMFGNVDNVTGIYFGNYGWELRGIATNCPNLVEVQLPDYDINMPNFGMNFNCFQNCTKLEYIYIPACCGYIDWDYDCFNGCTNLKTIVFSRWDALGWEIEKITTIGANTKNDNINVFYYPEGGSNYTNGFYKNLQNIDTNGFVSRTYTEDNFPTITFTDYNVENYSELTPTIIPNTSEDWVFTLEDGTEVTKKIFLGV